MTTVAQAPSHFRVQYIVAVTVKMMKIRLLAACFNSSKMSPRMVFFCLDHSLYIIAGNKLSDTKLECITPWWCKLARFALDEVSMKNEERTLLAIAYGCRAKGGTYKANLTSIWPNVTVSASGHVNFFYRRECAVGEDSSASPAEMAVGWGRVWRRKFHCVFQISKSTLTLSSLGIFHHKTGVFETGF